jgi:Ca2+-binding EF-hand superfamily protein
MTMNRSIYYTFLAGAVVVAGVGIAAAGKPPSSHPPGSSAAAKGYQSAGHGHGRTGQRFLSQYDLNHDGKVTRDEFNKATAKHFSEATGGGKQMSEKQFEGFRTQNLHQHADQSFKRADWNGDGKLTFDEYANPIRVSFERADRQSAGVIFCRPKNAPSTKPQQNFRPHRGSRGAGNFCSRDDLNHDGKVTRAELDQALHQQFAMTAKGGALNRDQFTSMQNSRAGATSQRAFQRLDSNHDGKLTLEEFSALQQRTFARMDKNGDGVIMRDEMTSSRRGRSYPSKQRHT